MKILRLFAFVLLFSLVIAGQAQEDSRKREMKYASGSADQALVWQETVRSKLRELLKIEDLWESHGSLALNPKPLASTDPSSPLYQDIEISTTPGRRIPIVVTIPEEAQPGGCAAVVCIHGHGHDRYKVYQKDSIYKGFATELAQRGVVTVALDVGQHEVYEEGRTLMGERLWDLIRGVDYLVSLKEVDPDRIGCAGLSLGGEMTMWLGAMDTRLNAVVSSGFLTVMDQMEQNHCMCWKFPGLRDLVDFADIYALIAPRPLFCQNGEKEPATQFTVELAKGALSEIQPAYSDLEAREKVELVAHPGGHEVDLPSLLEFFQEHLAIGE